MQEEVHGFRWVEERDLSGFVDGTENPAGEETRREVAVIKDGVDAGGSYVFVQRWEHNLKQLNRMSVHDQEMMIGRTKEANEEIDGDDRPVTSHLTRVDLKEDGKGLKIVRQSLPYGTASGTHGLYFCAYCARLHNIEQQLLSMFGDTDGKRRRHALHQTGDRRLLLRAVRRASAGAVNRFPYVGRVSVSATGNFRALFLFCF
ncbi:Dyp-type peroxidase [Enterobacter roggenkampii]|uniref:Dyp-type peroxidase n=1 Tax=Enterobacter roggenkampii TaxID=1812935 RepID=UPI003CC91BB8